MISILATSSRFSNRAQLVAWMVAGLATGCSRLIDIEELTLLHAPKDDGGSVDADPDVGPSENADASDSAPLHPDGAIADTSADEGATPADGAIADAIPDAREDTIDAGPSVRTVSGRLIDEWGHPLSSVALLVGGKTVFTQAPNGTFAADIAGAYDVVFVAPDGARWAYLGLTSNSPTLEIYGEPKRSQYLQGQIQGVSSPLLQDMHFAWSFGSDDGIGSGGALPGDRVEYADTSVDWRGPTATSGTLSALSWKASGPRAAYALPVSYFGFASTALTLQDGSSPATVPTINLAATTVTGKDLSGTIDTSGAALTEKLLYGVFGHAGAIPIIDDISPDLSFHYLAPVVTGIPSSASVAAVSGDWKGPHSYAVAHRANLAADASGVSLTIPVPPVPGSPPSGANEVTSSQEFTWSPGSDRVFILSLFMPINDFDYVLYYVVTGEPKARLPDFGGGVTLPSNTSGYWSVEAHGSWSSLDQAAAAGTLLDPFASGKLGGRDRNGFFARSEPIPFKTK